MKKASALSPVEAHEQPMHLEAEPARRASTMSKLPSRWTSSPIDAANASRQPRMYISVRAKFAIAMIASFVWGAFSIWAAMPWFEELAALTHWSFAVFAIGGIAVLPGFMNAFLVASLLMDRRPEHKRPEHYPGITILVAAYNEAGSIADTLESIDRQHYRGEFEVFVIDDGSSDATPDIVEGLQHRYPWLTLLRQPKNGGKSAALNRGLALARHDLVVTLDADSYLHVDALHNLVERYIGDPSDTRAVAGTMLVRNSRASWVTRMQEWDYFHGIWAIKRVQSFYHGTLVAQGAFSIYDRQALRDVGGWDECVGEDIVLTWSLILNGWRIGHAEDAVCFTNAPTKLKQFLRQRQRWARGMMEAFRRHWRILFAPRLCTAFVWWNVFFPWLDLAYTCCFVPGVIIAFFGLYWIAGPLTLILLPLSLLMNWLMYFIGRGTFVSLRLKVRYNPIGFLVYALAYSMILQPACVAGYFSELLGLRKTWGTK